MYRENGSTPAPAAAQPPADCKILLRKIRGARGSNVPDEYNKQPPRKGQLLIWCSSGDCDSLRSHA